MSGRLLIAALALVALATTDMAAQGRRGGGGGRGPVVENRARMDTLSVAFDLDKDQKKTIKTALDEAYKGAAPIRAELKKTRAALGVAAIGTDPAAIDAAAKAYAAQVTAMTAAEMKAFAEVLKPLSPEQKAKGTVQAFFLMRTIFLDDKKWDDVPAMVSY
jgi:Spy/CpxP family protein refolding chaperone